MVSKLVLPSWVASQTYKWNEHYKKIAGPKSVQSLPLNLQEALAHEQKWNVPFSLVHAFQQNKIGCFPCTAHKIELTLSYVPYYLTNQTLRKTPLFGARLRTKSLKYPSVELHIVLSHTNTTSHHSHTFYWLDPIISESLHRTSHCPFSSSRRQ